MPEKSLWLILSNFNPHSHKGSDAKESIVTEGLQKISIHTPTRGVTQAGMEEQQPTSDFNAHSHKGSDRVRSEIPGARI